VKIYDLLDMEMLVHAMIPGGYVKAQHHPLWPDLAILNYTDTCAFERAWNNITTTCRGLIYNVATGEVLARPFPKFFNYGEPGAPEIPLDAGVDVTDKLDGSLGILYPTPDGEWAVATRGSFDSEQARHATAVWRRQYAELCAEQGMPHRGVTMLFEIVYPGNRIVCDYGPTDDLFLLGAVDIEYGHSFGPNESEAFGNWMGPRTQEFTFPTFADAVAAPPRAGAEGLVVRLWHSEHRVKLKQEDYVALHRIITGCTKRRLWEHLAVQDCKGLGGLEFLVRRLFLGPARINEILAVGDDWLDKYLENTPEEFRAWVVEQVAEMVSVVAARRLELRVDFGILCGMAGLEPGQEKDRETSKKFVELVRAKVPEKFHMMMAFWRGHEIDTQLWRDIYPEHELPYRAVDEDVS
jgi:RNA ligase